jgi:predicted  nucleic acid-binding Zn-ribbon protein
VRDESGHVTPTIEKLLQVQEHDSRIMRLQREVSDLPKRKAEIESRLAEHRQALHDAKEKLKLEQSEVKKAELEVETRRQGVRKLREQQMQVKTNREFRAIEDEVAAAEKVIRGVEDQMLGLMERVETAQGGVRTREQDLKLEEESVRGDVARIDQRGAEIQKELEAVVALRRESVTGIDPAWLDPYERIIHSKKDRALVHVENSTCSGCHMKLPPYICHEARKQAAVVYCNYCGRMLC